MTDAGLFSNSVQMGDTTVMTVLKTKPVTLKEKTIQLIIERPETPEVMKTSSDSKKAPSSYLMDRRFKSFYYYETFLNNLIEASIEWKSKSTALVFHCHIVADAGNTVTALSVSIYQAVIQYLKAGGEEKPTEEPQSPD